MTEATTVEAPALAPSVRITNKVLGKRRIVRRRMRSRRSTTGAPAPEPAISRASTRPLTPLQTTRQCQWNGQGPARLTQRLADAACPCNERVQRKRGWGCHRPLALRQHAAPRFLVKWQRMTLPAQPASPSGRAFR